MYSFLRLLTIVTGITTLAAKVPRLPEATSKDDQAPTIAAVWDLHDTGVFWPGPAVWPDDPEPLDAFSPPLYPYDETTNRQLSHRSVLSTLNDSRKLVALSDLRRGGPFASVVKLRTLASTQNLTNSRDWAACSGWLITPRVVVTAGHCAFEHVYSLGPVYSVQAFLGYHGYQSIHDDASNVQARSGIRIATPESYITTSGGLDVQHDVSFILLDRPFDDVDPVAYEETPSRINETLGVAGYPSDLRLADDDAPYMWADFEQVSFDLDSSCQHMLQYTIATGAADSGAPIIRLKDNVVLGTHVYGTGLCRNANSGSVIGGTWGTDYPRMLTALTQVDEYRMGVVKNDKANISRVVVDRMMPTQEIILVEDTSSSTLVRLNRPPWAEPGCD